MRRTVDEIAAWLNGELLGDGKKVITGFAGLQEAGSDDLTFLANTKYAPLLKSTRAGAVLVPPDISVEKKDLTVIRVEDPSYAFSQVMSREIEETDDVAPGVHPTAIVSEEAILGEGAAIGPYVVIEKGVRLGRNCRIGAGCYLGRNVCIGDECRLAPHVVCADKVCLHNRVIIHSGSVIGADGFGFVQHKGAHHKIPQLGTVEIHDDVEIGACVTIDRARFDKTVIGEGTKIDNLVQIAHNVRIGKHCLIVAQVGISGSTVIEDHCILAGQAGLAGHLTVGKGSIVSAQAGVTQSLPAGSRVMDFPARPHMLVKRLNAHYERLPRYARMLKQLEKKVTELEEQLGNLKKKIVHG